MDLLFTFLFPEMLYTPPAKHKKNSLLTSIGVFKFIYKLLESLKSQPLALRWSFHALVGRPTVSPQVVRIDTVQRIDSRATQQGNTAPYHGRNWVALLSIPYTLE